MSKNTGATEDVKFNIGYGKGSADAKELVNTSGIPLHNEKLVLVNGKRVSTGYFSHSAIEQYTRCAKQYEYKYVKKEKGRLMFRAKMYGGVVVHDALDELVNSKIQGKPISKETFLTHIDRDMDEKFEKYGEQYKRASLEKLDPEPIDFGARIADPDIFKRLYISIGSEFYDGIYQNCKPISTEKQFIYHMEIDSGGTIPIVGFIDVIEELGGEPTIVDYKVGAKKSQNDADFSQQLTLYSMAESIPRVAISALQLGTTGGKNPAKAKKGEVTVFLSTRNLKDYARTTENVNATLKGIKAGAFPRSGMHNPIVCARTQCPYFDKCMTS